MWGRSASTTCRAVPASSSRAPVTPYVATQYTKPCDARAIRAYRSSEVPGAARSTRSMPRGDASDSRAPDSSTGRSGTIAPEAPAATSSSQKTSLPRRSTGFAYVITATGISRRAAETIARVSEGSAREAEKLLDQTALLGGGEVTQEHVLSLARGDNDVLFAGTDRDGLVYRIDAHGTARVLFQANARTAMSVGQASGLALVVAARAGIPVALYSPNEVKLAVTGDGRADKTAVQTMVTRLLNLRDVPKPPDAADALALACCHLWRAPLAVKVAT